MSIKSIKDMSKDITPNDVEHQTITNACKTWGAELQKKEAEKDQDKIRSAQNQCLQAIQAFMTRKGMAPAGHRGE